MTELSVANRQRLITAKRQATTLINRLAANITSTKEFESVFAFGEKSKTELDDYILRKGIRLRTAKACLEDDIAATEKLPDVAADIIDTYGLDDTGEASLFMEEYQAHLAKRKIEEILVAAAGARENLKTRSRELAEQRELLEEMEARDLRMKLRKAEIKTELTSESPPKTAEPSTPPQGHTPPENKTPLEVKPEVKSSPNQAPQRFPASFVGQIDANFQVSEPKMPQNSSHLVPQPTFPPVPSSNPFDPSNSLAPSFSYFSPFSKAFKIPDFHGNPTEYHHFMTMFTELVDKKCPDPLPKLSILLSSCKGEALESLRHIPPTPGGYSLALQRLEALFGDKDAQKVHLLATLRNLEKANSSGSSLLRTVNSLQTIVARMKAAGEYSDTSLLKEAILEKFPYDIKRKVSDKESDSTGPWTTDQVLNEIERLVKRVRNHEMRWGQESSEEHQQHTVRYTQPECVLCNSRSHTIRGCTRYKSASERSEKLQTLGRCFICFSREHKAEDCHHSGCFHCGRKHSIHVCFKKEQDSKDTVDRSRKDKFQANGRNRDKSHHRFHSSNSRSRPRSYSRPANGGQGRSKSRSFQSGKSSERDTRQDKNSSQDSKSSQDRKRSSSRAHKVNTVQTQETEVPEQQIQLIAQAGARTRMKIVPVKMKNHLTGEMERIFALLDGGGQTSFIIDSTAKRLGLPLSDGKTVTVVAFGGEKTKAMSYTADTSLYDERNNEFPVQLLTTRTITTPVETEVMNYADLRFMEERGIKLDSVKLTSGKTVEPEIMIGLNYYDRVTTCALPSYELPSGYFAKPTIFGYIVSGCKNIRSSRGTEIHAFTTLIEEDISEHLIATWKTEAIGINDELTQAEEDAMVEKQFEDTVQLKEGKITVRLPFKPNKNELTNNHKLALSRLHSLSTMRSRKPEIWEQYVKIMEEQLENGIYEDVTEDMEDTDNIIYYLPHQAVVKQGAHKTKVRIVLDGSSKQKGALSVNDVLYAGPILLPHIVGVLLRARLQPHVLTGDIEKAFHQIALHPDDKDATRLLWLKDPSRGPENGNIRILRHGKLPFGLKPSPYLLAKAIKHALSQNKEKELCEEITKNIYVDDLILGASSLEELLAKYQKSQSLFASLGMRMREYLTDSEEVNRRIKKEDLSTNSKPKILGIPWDPTTDTITIEVNMKYTENATKSTILAAVNKTFDPIGLVCPVLLKGKLLIQELWMGNYNWKSPISKELQEKWKSICESADKAKVTIPRLVLDPNNVTKREIHTFVDASKHAFAACVYLTYEYTDGSRKSMLLKPAHRVTPIKELRSTKGISIPRLELMALTIGTRLTRFVVNHLGLPLDKICIYGDSEIALSWLHSTKKLETFVENRVKSIKTIRDHFESEKIPCKFFHVPTDQNPADFATRGLDKEQIHMKMWWHGPDFLQDPLHKSKESAEFTFPEEKEESPEINQLTVQLTETDTKIKGKIAQKRDFDQMQRVAIEVLRSIKNKSESEYTGKDAEQLLTDTEWGQIQKGQEDPTAEEYAISELFLIRLMQKEIDIKLGEFSNLNLFRDEKGIIRCKGRLGKSALPLDTQEPILLARDNEVTQSIIRLAHEKSGHQAANGTLCKLREKFWVPQGRRQVGKVIRKCLNCQTYNNKAYKYPDFPSLPAGRVTRTTRPYVNTGLDYAGPFKVTEMVNGSAVTTKKWICLFTCMGTRNIHLEMVSDLSSVQFILALKRFMNIYGQPENITSDNGTNFKLGNEVVAEFLKPTLGDKREIENQTAHFGIKWTFITPLAPWKGGFYERMVRNVKDTLHKTKSLMKTVTADEFRTILTEIATMVNSRPLTYVRSELNESVAIRPCDFLVHQMAVPQMQNITGDEPNTDPSFTAAINTKEQAIARISHIEQILDKLWEYWTNEYLTSLRAQKGHLNTGHSAQKQPGVDDIVLIADKLKKRAEWTMAKIITLIPSDDGQVRSAAVSAANGKEYVRSINMLIPLELDLADVAPALQNATATTEEGKTDVTGDPAEPPDKQKHQDLSKRATKNITRKNRTSLPREAKKNVHYVMTTKMDDAEQKIKPRWSSPLSANQLQAIITLLLIQTCSGVTILCQKGGALIEGLNPASQTEVCGADECRILRNTQATENIQFAPEITANDYTVLVKSLNGYNESSHTAHCQANPYCEQIKCTVCLQILFNSHCFPKTAICLTIALTTLFLVLLKMAKKPIKAAWKGVKCILAWFYNLRILCHCSAPTTEDTPLLEIHIPTIKKWKTSTLIKVAIVIMLTLPVLSQACQDTITMKGQVNKCTNGGKCEEHDQLQINLNTFRPETCIQARQKDDEITTQLRITLKQIKLRCEKKSLFYTEERKVVVQHSKRCPFMGSCDLIGDTCSQISPNSTIPELGIANEHPGTTYCTNSCGGQACGCILHGAQGCLFWRPYFQPSDTEPFEVFHCPKFHSTVTVQCEYLTRNETDTHEFDLSLNQVQFIHNSKLVITDITTGILPLLANKFATNGKITTMLTGHENFQYSCEGISTNGSLYNCTVRDTCNCRPTRDTVSCYCNDNTVIRDLHNVLPIAFAGGQLEMEEGTVTMTSGVASAALSLTLSSTFTKTESKIDTDHCQANEFSLSGCYNCLPGALAKIRCTSTKTQVLGSVTCLKQTFAVQCNQNGSWNYVRFFSEQATIDETCSITCGENPTSFKLQGSLEYLNGPSPFIQQLMAKYNYTEPATGFRFNFGFPDITGLLKSFLEHAIFVLAAVLATCVLVAILLTGAASCATKGGAGTAAATATPLGPAILFLTFLRKAVALVLWPFLAIAATVVKCLRRI